MSSGRNSTSERASSAVRPSSHMIHLQDDDHGITALKFLSSDELRQHIAGELQISTLQHETITLTGPDRTRSLYRLGVAYSRRFERYGNAKDIESAIKHVREAVASTPLNSGDRSMYLTCLGSFYRCYFDWYGEAKNINLAIEVGHEAVDSTSLNSAYQWLFLLELGLSYSSRFEHLGEVEDINKAIEKLHEALASIPRGSEDRPIILANLGNSYCHRFRLLGGVKDINSAIELQCEAVASIPLDHADRSWYLNSLGGSYLHRFRRLGEMKDIEESIRRRHEAVTSTPLNNAYLLKDLGDSYRRRFQWFVDVKDIDLAIELQDKAVACTPFHSTYIQGHLNSLGLLYVDRFKHLGEAKDIDTAIAIFLQAVASAQPNSAYRPELLSHLASSYHNRFIRFRDVEDVDSAIKYLREAVESTPPGRTYRPNYISDLGTTYRLRFARSNNVADIDASIEQHCKAIDSTHPSRTDRSLFLSRLATAYARRFLLLFEVQDIDLAIERQHEAVTSTSLHHANRARFLNSLAEHYYFRYKQVGERKDLDLALRHQREAVSSTPLNSTERPLCLLSLGTYYYSLFKQSGITADLSRSVSNLRLSSLSQNGLPSTRLFASLQWAYLAHNRNLLASACEAYNQAIHLLPQVAWIGLDAEAQLRELAREEVQSLGCDAAACMIALAQSEPHNEQRHLGRAIELLDQGRSILWSQTSNFKQDLEDLCQVGDPQLAGELNRVAKVLGQGCFRSSNDTPSEAVSQRYRYSAQEWEELVCRIRKLPGFDHFLLPPPISMLHTAAAEGPVVIINSSEHRCDAIIMPPQGDLVMVPLPGLTTNLNTLLDQQQKFTMRKSISVGTSSSNNAQSIKLQHLLNQTWLLAGGPIVKRLEGLGLLGSGSSSVCRVWWCLTGSLSFLPIHASFPPTEPHMGMMDVMVSSYTPTISALLRARRSQKIPTFRMLAVGQPNASGMAPLPGVKEEIAFISRRLGADAETLQDSTATIDNVVSSLPASSWAHFACHGVQDPETPMDSGLVMWNGDRLTLSRIVQSSLASAQFAFLSSCQSASGSKELPNEALHLAAGLQFIGFRGVIGTMWSVGDSDALAVAKQVYEELFKDGTAQASASDAALALHRAVLHLRDHVPLDRWVPFIHFGL